MAKRRTQANQKKKKTTSSPKPAARKATLKRAKAARSGVRKANHKQAKAAKADDHDERPVYEVHIVTESTGNLADHLVSTVVTQFPDVAFRKVFHAFQESKAEMRKTIAGINAENALVFYGLADPEAERELQKACIERRIPYFDYSSPLFKFFSDAVGRLPVGDVEALHRLDADYFRRIEAIEFSINHDDGLGTATMGEADLCLVGISRVSKSPTALLLASRGYKVANVSLAPPFRFPREFAQLKGRIVALTMQPKRLHEIRTARLKAFGVAASSYSHLREVVKEVVAAETEYRRRGYPIIDVTSLTVEQTSAMILDKLHLRGW